MTTFDAIVNAGYSTVLTAPVSPTAGTSLVLQSGEGARCPAVPFNAVVWVAGGQPNWASGGATGGNWEVIRVTARSGDTLSTIVRAQEGTTARTIVAGDQIHFGPTAKMFTDMQAPLAPLTVSSTVFASSATFVGTPGTTGTRVQVADFSGYESVATAVAGEFTHRLQQFSNGYFWNAKPKTHSTTVNGNQTVAANGNLTVTSTASFGANANDGTILIGGIYYAYDSVFTTATTFKLYAGGTFTNGQTVQEGPYPKWWGSQTWNFGGGGGANLIPIYFFDHVDTTRYVGTTFRGNSNLTGFPSIICNWTDYLDSPITWIQNGGGGLCTADNLKFLSSDLVTNYFGFYLRAQAGADYTAPAFVVGAMANNSWDTIAFWGSGGLNRWTITNSLSTSSGLWLSHTATSPGAVAQRVTATVTNGSAIVSATTNFNPSLWALVGAAVTGTGIPGGTTIASIGGVAGANPTTSFTMSAAATGAGDGTVSITLQVAAGVMGLSGRLGMPEESVVGTATLRGIKDLATTGLRWDRVDGLAFVVAGSDVGRFALDGTLKITGAVTLTGGLSTPLAVAQGGTALASYTAGDLLYASGTTTLTKLPKGTAAQQLVSGTTPAWRAQDGWISEQGTWQYGSAVSFAIAGDQTGVYTIGARVSWDDGTNTGTAPGMGAVNYTSIGSGTLTASAPLTAVTSDVTGDTLGKTAHGVANGTPVVVTGLTNTTGITNGTIYFVVGTAANTFQLALTVGGSAINLTGSNDTGLTVTAATLVTLCPSMDYSGGIQNHAITLPRYSYAANPQGYPTRFRIAPTNLSGWSTAPSFSTILTSVASVIATSKFTKTAHGLVSGDVIMFAGISTTTGVANVTVYWVIKIDADNFQVATTQANQLTSTAITLGGTADAAITVSTLTNTVRWSCIGSDMTVFIRHVAPGTSNNTTHSIDGMPRATTSTTAAFGAQQRAATMTDNGTVVPGTLNIGTGGTNFGCFCIVAGALTNTASGSSRVNSCDVTYTMG